VREKLPPTEVLLRLEPEELAIPLLNCLIGLERGGQINTLLLHNFMNTLAHQGSSVEELQAVTEAWVWLEQQLMIAPAPGKSGIVYVTSRGKQLADKPEMVKYIRSNLIIPDLLDPQLKQKVMPLFIRGDYDTAVFQAFKEVEVRVRNAASLPPESIGTELMRTAFNPDNGMLADKNRPRAEREAMSHLFAGAIGLFKNPSSHREVDWNNPGECMELIYLANHLLRIVQKHLSSIVGNSTE
jgi:uncharacterized protein (TIGR02391 family)